MQILMSRVSPPWLSVPTVAILEFSLNHIPAKLSAWPKPTSCWLEYPLKPQHHMAAWLWDLLIHTIYKSMWTPFKLVDLDISATPLTDIKLSTQPCNLHSQTLSVEWPYWRAQWLSTWHRHRMPPFQQASPSNFCLARASTVSAVIVRV
jgi:hypothetical protein